MSELILLIDDPKLNPLASVHLPTDFVFNGLEIASFGIERNDFWAVVILILDFPSSLDFPPLLDAILDTPLEFFDFYEDWPDLIVFSSARSSITSI